MSRESFEGGEKLKLDYSLIETKDFAEAVEIAKENTSGKLWVIGGFLARTFSGTDTKKGYIDFLTEKLNEDLQVPNKNWKRRKRQLFPGFKFEREDGLSIDISEITQWKTDRGMPPTPETVQKLAPFKHMAIMYDVNSKELIGNAGIEAMLKKETAINNIQETEKYIQSVEKYQGMTIKQLLDLKAAELNFKPNYEYMDTDGNLKILQ